MKWHNVFVASDVFGSNFDPKSDTKQRDVTMFEDWSVTNHRYLARRS
jgi:hypothetical protein